MGGTSKPIRFLPHASQQLAFRGSTEHEVIEAIREANWEPAKHGCQVRPIFVEESVEIVVITVYVYYF